MAPTVLGVSSSGLIYAVIVGAWAAYLVPMWLRRQDELNEARPTERFSTAIRLLSGRGAMERRYARTRERERPGTDGPADPHGPEHHPERADRTGGPGDPADVDVRDLAVPAAQIAPTEHHRPDHEHADRAGRPARAKVLARRRRMTTVLFLAFTAGSIAAAVGGLAYLWAPAAPGVLLTLYIAHLRRAERRRFEFTMDQRRAAEAARRLRDRPSVPRPSGAVADRRAVVEQTDHAEWVDQTQLPPDDGWEPAPVPLPTYVTAPVAPRAHGHAHGQHGSGQQGHGQHGGPGHGPGRAAGSPDAWNAARPAPTARSAAAASERAVRDRTPLFDQYAPPSAPLADPLDRPRAANE